MAPIVTSLASIVKQFGIGAVIAAGDGPVITYTGASGGVISDYRDPGPGTRYRAHIFTSTGTFTVTDPAITSVEYLVVAGGGGGAVGGGGGGGGAGGLRTNLSGHPLAGSAFPVSPGPYGVTVGAGGAAAAPGVDTFGTKGTPSAFGPIASEGGGRGKSTPTAGDSSDGGSGGGGYGASTRQPAGSGNSPATSPSQGNPGGDGAGGSGFHGGGGGGAGGPGQAGQGAPGVGGFGGLGSQVLIAGPPSVPQPVGAPGPSGTGWFAGGGGGGGQPTVNTGGSGGGPGGPFAGGGPGGTAPGGNGTSGTFATGGGGGGGCNPGTGAGGAGGSGIVVVRYTLPASTGTAKATGGSISYYNGQTIHTFTSSGTFATAPNWTSATVEYVVIGGGGSGGLKQYVSGGGGAGAYRTGTTPIGAHPVSTTVQVGAGGVVAELGPAQTPSSADGTPSYFGIPITAPGGGGGGTYPDPGVGRSGGSGGGGAAASSPGGGSPASGSPFPGLIQATPSSGWGHAGGNSNTSAPVYGAGGGGGAGGAGGNGSPTAAGIGGAGIQLPSTFRNPASTVGSPGPTSAPTPNGFDTSGKYWVAGGGAGSSYPTGTTPGSGGGPGGPYAGGGAGGAGNNGGDGGTNTGGGGGGQEREPGPASQAGRGGSGIVLIAYPS